MRIGVISDTHDRLPTFRRGLEILRQQGVEMILHAGDYVAPFAAKLIAPDALDLPLVCIYGNNDGERAGLKKTLPNIIDGPAKLQADGKTIAMHHFIDWFEPADIDSADILISGHNHSVVNEVKDGKLFLNPGECCGWLTGRCTVAVLQPGEMSAQILDVPTD
jgi:hypothetical protein